MFCTPTVYSREPFIFSKNVIITLDKKFYACEPETFSPWLFNSLMGQHIRQLCSSNLSRAAPLATRPPSDPVFVIMDEGTIRHQSQNVVFTGVFGWVGEAFL